MEGKVVNTRKIQIGDKIFTLKELTGADASRALGKFARIDKRGNFDLNIQKFADEVLKICLGDAAFREVQQGPAEIYLTLVGEILSNLSAFFGNRGAGIPQEKTRTESESGKMFG